jgi:predicted nucleic acid-binding protein
MMAVDTSVVVAAFATWHEAHALAVGAMAEDPHLPAPCALEAYAVLTRLPPPHRAPPAIVRDFLAVTFADRWFSLPHELAVAIVGTLVDRGVGGGASYDAAVALVAAHAGATLVTLDARARRTYERMGVVTRYLA